MTTFLTNKLPGRTVRTLDGKEYLWFSGTDYLGMAYNLDFQSFLKEGFENYGTHFGSSRNGSLRLSIYSEAEERFTNWQTAESALLISSGMLAGQLLMLEIDSIIHQIDKPDRIIYHYAPKVHPAIWGTDYQPNTLEWNEWAAATVTKINADISGTQHIICSDAIGSPLVEQFDFSIFNKIIQPDSCRFIIDQSHCLGVSGENGTGIAGQFENSLGDRLIFVSSLNKALGIPAGVIWGERKIIDLLSKSPLFAGASPSAPAYIFAFNKMLETGCYAKSSAELIQNVSHFNKQLQNVENHFVTIPNYPVLYNVNPALFDFLLESGIMASCFSYPLPSDQPVTRIAISAAHQKEDLDWLAEVCKRFIS
ncbi:8-amino-7-oxononanoate synthase/2-amino-3-ketobutyrate coenzyme A ligase [Dyadobacter sp. CECT 9623]|uniref:8-amino-7-oxononanoate synthase/2-amino-3-ketobutyrate coenzyme A ligase n=1 Tax=Dyadobacter linearis TaxID=2823330 RepID=A0ABN7RG08_9BACT|nr:pyridoxal phosphate-dependent aminotransferase family protein [Dyadobacter sp. CECT 9623]CAG5071866.1 8-amino-7-oxononanoate synthase/2-amino-3-ketobutyrate coenzyme A ligase [Dyadobacter sp. CECT 9623]